MGRVDGSMTTSGSYCRQSKFTGILLQELDNKMLGVTLG